MSKALAKGDSELFEGDAGRSTPSTMWQLGSAVCSVQPNVRIERAAVLSGHYGTSRHKSDPMLWIVLVLASAGLLLPPSLAQRGDPSLWTGLWLLGGLLILFAAYLAIGKRLGWWRAPAMPFRPRAMGRRMGTATVLLVAVAAWLRLYGLGAGMWTDEVSTLVHYVRPSLGEIVTTYDSQNHHVFFSLLAHLSTTLFGESVWSLRLPAALFGIATVWALILLAREVSSDREATLTGLVLTFSYQHIWFSQSARGYSGVLFFGLLSSVLFLRGLRGGRATDWVGYWIAVALGTYTHLTMVFVVCAQLMFYAADGWRRSRRNWHLGDALHPFLLGFVPAGILTLLLYAPVLPQMMGGARSDVSDVATWRSASWMMREIVNGLGLDPSLYGAMMVAGVVVSAGLWSYSRQNPVIVWLLLGSVVVGGGLTVMLNHHLWPRFFFFAAGFGVLVVVRGLTEVGRVVGQLCRLPAKGQAWVATGLTVTMVVVLGRSLPYVYRPKQDFLGAMQYIQKGLEPGDAVVTTGVAASPYALYYEPEWRSVDTLAELTSTRRRLSN